MTADYGVRGRGRLRQAATQLDEGLDTAGIVHFALNHYDALLADVQSTEGMDDQIPNTAGTEHVNNDLDDGEGRYEPHMPVGGDDGPSIPGDDPHGDEGGPYPDAAHGRVDDDLHVVDDDVEPMMHPEEALLEDSARTLLFAGASLSSLGATLILLNLCRTHGTSNAFISDLFKLLAFSILPVVNTLPRSEYAASKILKKMGLAYDAIHCCPNSCMLFRGPGDKDLEKCRICDAARYKVTGDSKVPVKVLRHFPLVPRLQRMFATPVQAAFQTYHWVHRSLDGMQRMASDSKQWALIDSEYPDFAREPRNIRLGLATDGVNPFSIKRSTWSTWPILLLNYNLPPWLTTKKYFIILSLLIPGPQSVTSKNFDVFLQPLLDELLQLWYVGFRTWDAALYNDNAWFTMHAMVIWTIHDFPALGIVSGCVTKGYMGCPVCGPANSSRRSRLLKKIVWDNQHRKWLCPDHEWRSNTSDFDGEPELAPPPTRISAEEHVFFGRLRETFVANGSSPKADDPARVYGVNRLSSLWRLPYWEVCQYSNIVLPCRMIAHVKPSPLRSVSNIIYFYSFFFFWPKVLFVHSAHQLFVNKPQTKLRDLERSPLAGVCLSPAVIQCVLCFQQKFKFKI